MVVVGLVKGEAEVEEEEEEAVPARMEAARGTYSVVGCCCDCDCVC